MRRFALPLAFLTGIYLDSILFCRLNIGGIRPDALLVVIVSAGVLLGSVKAGIMGVGIGLFMEPIAKWGTWMDLVSIYIIPIGATLGAVSWFYVMKKDDLLAAINTGSRKTRGALWYSVGRYVYVPLALVLCLVALIGGVAF